MFVIYVGLKHLPVFRIHVIVILIKSRALEQHRLITQEVREAGKEQFEELPSVSAFSINPKSYKYDV